MPKTLMDMFKKTYIVPVSCWNCGTEQDLKIPKGILIKDFIKSKNAACGNCGCASLETPTFPRKEETEKEIIADPQEIEEEEEEDDEWAQFDKEE